MRVGIAQIDISIGDREANRRRVSDWMKRYFSVSQEETAIVLPEIWDVGYALDRADELADPEGESAAEFLGGLAKEYGVWFVGGSVLARTHRGAVNRAQVINPRGELVAHYDKVHLFPIMDEPNYLVAGDSDCRLQVADVNIGLAICYDIRFPEFAVSYALQGAQVLVVSAQWPMRHIDHWRVLLKARAIENMMFVVACNRIGTSADQQFGGRSVVLGPWGETLYEASDDHEEGTFLSLDPSQIEPIRGYVKTLLMRRPDVYRL